MKREKREMNERAKKGNEEEGAGKRGGGRGAG